MSSWQLEPTLWGKSQRSAAKAGFQVPRQCREFRPMSLPAERIASDTEEVDSASNHLPDDHIIRRVIDGDVALFELILRRYNQRLFRVARSIIGDDGEAEDIVQEAYVRAFQSLRQFEGRSLF